MISVSLLGVTCAGAPLVKRISWRSGAGQIPQILHFPGASRGTQQHDAAPMQDGFNSQVEYEGGTLVVLRRECECLACSEPAGQGYEARLCTHPVPVSRLHGLSEEQMRTQDLCNE